MSLKLKTMTSLTAISLSALIVTGTFAWTNLNPQRLNEWQGTSANPATGAGGTLHDDYEENGAEKHVYIENWGNEDLYVRIRMDEYMEIGSGAGLKAISADSGTGEIVHNPNNLAAPLINGANIDEPKTWETHIPYESANNDSSDFHNYWDWLMGGQKYYYPAPESSRVDKNYVASGSTDDIAENSINSAGIQAKQTRMAHVITMEQWKEVLEGQIGDYWVIDTDGWAYWAAPLGPGDATGLLLREVNLKEIPDKDYYYGINVIAQMATKDGTIGDGDLDSFKSFGLAENSGWTDDGKALVEKTVSDGSSYEGYEEQQELVCNSDQDQFMQSDATQLSYMDAAALESLTGGQDGISIQAGLSVQVSVDQYGNYTGDYVANYSDNYSGYNIDNYKGSFSGSVCELMGYAPCALCQQLYYQQDTPITEYSSAETQIPGSQATEILVQGTEQTVTPVSYSQPTATPVPAHHSTATPVPSSAPTATPAPAHHSTATPVPSSTPTATPAPVHHSTATPVPSSTPTATPVPPSTPTATPVPTHTPKATPVPSHTPKATPVPTHTPKATPVPTSKPTAAPVPSHTPKATPVPSHTATPVPSSKPTATQVPWHQATPLPSRTPTGTQSTLSNPTAAPDPTRLPTVTPITWYKTPPDTWLQSAENNGSFADIWSLAKK